MFLALMAACQELSLSVPPGPISGNVPITLEGPAEAMDIFVDGLLIAQGEGPEVTWLWDTSAVEDGVHVVRGECGDLVEMATTEILGSIGDELPPAVEFISPQPGPVTLPVRISLRVQDNHEVASVQLLDGEVVLAVLLETPPWEVEISDLSAGEHTLLVQAEDEAGNVGEASLAIQVE